MTNLSSLAKNQLSKIGSFIRPHNLQYFSASYSMNNIISNKNYIIGVFCIILFDYRNNRTSCFFFLNLEKQKIENYTLYKGRYFNRMFSIFILNTIKCFQHYLTYNIKDINLNVFIPKLSMNNKIKDTCQNIFNIKPLPYIHSTFDNQLLLESRKMIKGIPVKDLSDEKLTDVIKYLNKKFETYNNSQKCSKGWNSRIYKNFHNTNNSRKYSTEAYDDSKDYCNLEILEAKALEEFNKLHKPKIDKSKIYSHWEVYWITVNIKMKKLPDIKMFIHSFGDYIIKNRVIKKKELMLSVQLRVRFAGGVYRSLTKVFIVNFDDVVRLSEILGHGLGLKSGYEEYIAERLIMVFKVYSKDYPRKTPYPKELRFVPKHNRKGYVLPASVNLSEWGDCNYTFKDKIAQIKIYNSTNIAKVHITDTSNYVQIFSPDYRELLSFFDYKTDPNNPHTFRRDFGYNESLYFENGTIKFYKRSKFCKFIKKIKEQNLNKIKVITMDLETRIEGGKLKPVIIALYDGKDKKVFPIWEFNGNWELMLESAFKSIMRRKYYGYKVYFHNLSYFDGVFILKTLVNMDVEIETKIRDSKILSLHIKHTFTTKNGEKECIGSFTIMDSLLILPSKLEDLSVTFKCENKGMFPLKILNNYLHFNYSGDIPEMRYFYYPNPNKDFTGYKKFIKKYNEYKNSFTEKNIKWNLKENLIDYCVKDCISLHQVVTTFAQKIKEYNVNIFKYPTLPSIAFAVFRCKFLQPNVKIPIIIGNMYHDIRFAYYGGFVDVYSLFSYKTRRYDVNSLYPTSMLSFPLPTGEPKYFEGDPKRYVTEEELFGYVYVTVHAPKTLDKPILPYKTHRKGSWTTIYPTGSWDGWYFTEEIKNAEKYGYKFEIHKGYLFEKSFIFTDYVTTFYDIKSSVDPKDPWYLLAKLFLNSLYGRFGMDPELEINEFLSESEFDEIMKDPDIEVNDHIWLGMKILTTYAKTVVDEDEEKSVNVSVAVAAAITSWSRIYMTQFIMKYNDSLIYIDTDGIKVSCDLDENEVGKGLGKMKYEGSYKESIYLAPKVYGGITVDNEQDVKIKGYKNFISYWHLKSLLYEDSLKVEHEKWTRCFAESTIKIVNQIYTISATENKRILIRDCCGKLIKTKPYEIRDYEIAMPEGEVLFYLPIIPLLPSIMPNINEVENKQLEPEVICFTGSLNIIPITPYIRNYIPRVIYLSGSIYNKVIFKVTNMKSGDVSIFTSAPDCASFLKSHRSTVYRNLNTKLYKGKYKIESVNMQ